MFNKSINQVTLLGRIGQEPELKFTQYGTQICTATLATNESYKDKDGEWQDVTEWHNLVFWNKLAETAGNYLKKGELVYIEGKLKTSNYEKEGIKKYITEIVVKNLIMLNNKDKG